MPLPCDRWVRLLLAPTLVFLATALDRNYQTDLWHHLARGRLIAAEGRMIDDDRFTFTIAGEPLRDGSWLWQLVFSRLHEVGGLPLLVAVNSLLLALAVGVLVGHAARRSGSVTAASAFAALAVLGLWQVLLIRPQTLSILLFALTGYILERSRGNAAWLLVPPVLVALWANLHGGFPVGLILVGGSALGAWLDDGPRAAGLRVACLLGCLAATCVNPYGVEVYRYVLLTTNTASARGIDEWLPPGTGLLIGRVWIVTLLLLLLLLGRSPQRPAWRDLVLLGAFLPLACSSSRMIAWWLLVVTPVLAALAGAATPVFRRADEGDRRPSLGAALTLAGFLLAAGLSLPWLERFNPLFVLQPARAHRVEVDLQAAADRLSAEPRGGRVYSRFSWGEYLGWALHPRFSVFMDGRIELVPDRVWGEYQEVTRAGAGWRGVLDAYGVNALVLDAGGLHAALMREVEASGGWRSLGRFGDAVVYVRDLPGK